LLDFCSTRHQKKPGFFKNDEWLIAEFKVAIWVPVFPKNLGFLGDSPQEEFSPAIPDGKGAKGLEA